MAILSFITAFDINQRKFRIQDTSNYSGQGISITNVKGILKLTTPRGVTYETTSYTTPDVTPATSLYSGWIALPQNASGYILAGTYTIQYSIQDSGNGNAISTQTNSYTYSFIVPEIVITQTPDGYNSTFESKDDTVYGTYTSLSRTHTVTPPSGSPLSVTSNSNATIDYAADIWSGEWASTITSVLVYTGSDGLIINCTITDTKTVTAYNIDMNVIRGYIDIIRERYFTALDDDRTEAYELNSRILQINTAYSEYDLALYYNDLLTAYDRAVDIMTQLSDIIPVGSSTEIIPFSNHGSGGGSGHNPVTINSTYAYGASITSSQVLSLGLATASHGGVIPQLVGGSTYYFGGDGTFHVLTGGGDVYKTDFTAFDSVRAITATNITNWTTAYNWGNHASAGYALLSNVYTKTNLQTQGQASVHFNNLTNKPTTLAGYGITDGMQGNTAITAATHTKITYDTKGLVTGGTDLIASDIPSLDWSKITTGKPTTLSGYGITDAYTKTQTGNLTWDWLSIIGTPTTLLGYGITNAYTKTETNALTWAWSAITGTPTTLGGYGITDALSTSSAAANVIDSGLGNKFLADDATYKYINFSGVSDKQVVFINGSTPTGDDFFLFDDVTNTLYVSNVVGDIVQVESSIDFIGSDSHSGSSSGFRKWGDVRIKQNNGNLIFKDHYYRKTLSELVSGATNFWTQNGTDIYFGTGTNKVGINQANPTAELEVAGHIIADYFDSSYFRYKNSNILIGTNAGDNETGSNLLYISNSNTATPLIYGDFTNQEIIFNADVYIDEIKRLAFTDSTVSVRRDSLGNLEFRDLNANSGNPLTLNDLSTISSNYALKSDFISYASVNSITAANLVTWGKASILTTAGAGTKFLTDDGTYQTGGGGGVTPTDYTFKWDSGSIYYRPYTNKTEAGGVSSGGKFFNGTDTVTATNRLNYDGNFYATNLYSGGVTVQTALTFSNGLINTSGTVKLGGTLTEITLVDISSYDLEFLASSNVSGVVSFQGDGGSQVICGYDYANIGHGTGGLFQINSTGALFSSGTGLGGIKYNADYSEDYTDRSLVDKGYVDTHTYSYTFLNGLTNTSGTIKLGGMLTDFTTYIDGHTQLLFGWNNELYQFGANAERIELDCSNVFGINISGGTALVQDMRTTHVGLQYTANYSSHFTDRSLVDKGYVTGYAEPKLGNPASDGYILSSTAAGVRSWIAPPSGGVTPVDDILDWSTNKYTPYTSITNTSLILSTVSSVSTQNATGYLNINGQLIAGSSHTSNNRTAIHGISYSSIGVSGESNSGYGVAGGSTDSVGTAGTSTNNTGIYGASAYSYGGFFKTTSGSKIAGFSVGNLETNYISNVGQMFYLADGYNTFVVTPGVLKDFYTDASNSGTGETDLYTYTVPANIFAIDGDKLVINYSGIYYADDSINSILKVYFAGTSIGTIQPEANLIDTWMVKVQIIRTSSSTCRTIVELDYNIGGTGKRVIKYTELTSKNWTTTNIVKITGTSSASSYITAKFGYIEYKPTAIN